MAKTKHYYLDTQKNWNQFEVPDRDIGGGVSGFVFPISADKVVKIYTNNLSSAKKLELLRKVSRMAFQFASLAAIQDLPLAWPLGPVFHTEKEIDENNFCGFVMPRVHNLFNLEDVIIDEQLGSKPISGPDRIRIARRIAEIVTICHDADLVIGDINMRNVVVSENTLQPTVIDCDSFQFRRFTSDAGTIDFASAELLRKVERNGGKFEGVVRKQSDDCHALAVLIFKMLMNGRHPYDIRRASVAVGARSSAIVAREFPYASTSHAAIPTQKDARRYDCLDPTLKGLFERVLLYGEHLPAEAWVGPLDQFAALPAAALITPNFGEAKPKRVPQPQPQPKPQPQQRSRVAVVLAVIVLVVLLVIWLASVARSESIALEIAAIMPAAGLVCARGRRHRRPRRPRRPHGRGAGVRPKPTLGGG
jgi:DNA-binding helix-hairpin-helix protein with protein kinase domain